MRDGTRVLWTLSGPVNRHVFICATFNRKSFTHFKCFKLIRKYKHESATTEILSDSDTPTVTSVLQLESLSYSSPILFRKYSVQISNMEPPIMTLFISVLSAVYTNKRMLFSGFPYSETHFNYHLLLYLYFCVLYI